MKHIYRFLVLFLVLNFLSACSSGNRDTYEKMYDKNFKKIQVDTISVTGDNYYLLDKIKKSFAKFKIKTAKGKPYRVVLLSHYVLSCANPLMHAIPADYNGYIRLSLFYKKREIYRVQKDFRSNIDDKEIEDLVGILVNRVFKNPV